MDDKLSFIKEIINKILIPEKYDETEKLAGYVELIFKKLGYDVSNVHNIRPPDNLKWTGPKPIDFIQFNIKRNAIYLNIHTIGSKTGQYRAWPLFTYLEELHDGQFDDIYIDILKSEIVDL